MSCQHDEASLMGSTDSSPRLQTASNGFDKLSCDHRLEDTGSPCVASNCEKQSGFKRNSMRYSRRFSNEDALARCHDAYQNDDAFARPRCHDTYQSVPFTVEFREAVDTEYASYV